MCSRIAFATLLIASILNFPWFCPRSSSTPRHFLCLKQKSTAFIFPFHPKGILYASSIRSVFFFSFHFFPKLLWLSTFSLSWCKRLEGNLCWYIYPHLMSDISFWGCIAQFLALPCGKTKQSKALLSPHMSLITEPLCRMTLWGLWEEHGTVCNFRFKYHSCVILEQRNSHLDYSLPIHKVREQHKKFPGVKLWRWIDQSSFTCSSYYLCTFLVIYFWIVRNSSFK